MKRQSRFEKFEPITVRAAARVLYLGRTGRLSAPQVESYVRHLAAMDPHASPVAHGRLRRVARRWSCLGGTGVPHRFQMSRRKGAGAPGTTVRKAVRVPAALTA
jgi:hypothetical protein